MSGGSETPRKDDGSHSTAKMLSMIVDMGMFEAKCGCCLNVPKELVNGLLAEMALLYMYKNGVRKIINNQGFGDGKLSKEEQILALDNTIFLMASSVVGNVYKKIGEEVEQNLSRNDRGFPGSPNVIKGMVDDILKDLMGDVRNASKDSKDNSPI